MGLSCFCDNDYYEWYFTDPADVANAPVYGPLSTKRCRRCCSCKERIAVGDTSVRFERFRYAEWGTFEGRIYGEGNEVPMTPWFMCERCADLYYSLTELGFCVSIGESMLSLAREYAEMRADYKRAAAIRELDSPWGKSGGRMSGS